MDTLKRSLFALLCYVISGPYLDARQAICGAVTIIGGTGYQHGVESAETGINIESFEVRYFPEINKKLAGITGETVIRAISSVPSREVSFSGEVNNTTGIMAFKVAAACTFANDVATFAATPGTLTGTLLLDDMTETSNRSGWRSISGRCSSDPLCIAA